MNVSMDAHAIVNHCNITCQPNGTCSFDLSTKSNSANNPRLVNGIINLLLMIFNIGGNSLVFYIYNKLTKNPVFAFFVRVMAGLDLLTASTTMLIDVIMKIRPNDETNLNLAVMCKLSHFQVYANSLTSGCVLTLIAYQRYRKICHPLKRGVPLRKAKLVVISIGILCLAISIPALIVYGQMHITVLVANKPIQTVICRYDETYKGSVLQLATSYGLLLAFTVVLLSTVILYVMVSKAIRKFERRSSTMLPYSPTSDSVEIEQRDTPVSPVHGRPAPRPVRGRPLSSPVNGRPAKGATPQRPTDTPEHQNATNRLSQARASIFSVATNNHISAQMYKVFAVITVVFIVSYLPHLVVLILTKTCDLDNKCLTFTQRFFLELAYNCPYISTVANPLVYGFSSSEFRDQLRELLVCDNKCCRRRGKKHSRRIHR